MDILTNQNILCYLAAYLIGAIPFGYIFAKTLAKVNIRNAGSGSIGATNVLRVVAQENPALAKKLGALTLAADALKSLIPLSIAHFVFAVDASTLWTMGVLAVLGHCFSPYLRFEGGKGVATAFGSIIFLAPLHAVVAFVVWFVAAKTIRISSVSSLVALAALLGAYFSPLLKPFDVNSAAPLVIIAIVVVYKHLPNILRLVGGQESKVI